VQNEEKYKHLRKSKMLHFYSLNNYNTSATHYLN